MINNKDMTMRLTMVNLVVAKGSSIETKALLP